MITGQIWYSDAEMTARDTGLCGATDQGRRRLAGKAKRITRILKWILLVLTGLSVGYLCALAGGVLWAFEVKLQRWPTFVYAAPFTVKVGDNIDTVGLLERLQRQGYTETAAPMPRPGEWSRSGPRLNVFLNHSPVRGLGIVSGSITITLELSHVKSLNLARAREDVTRVTFEPELLHVFPASGFEPELCRPVPLEQVPSLLTDAIILTEDTYFFSHGGIDFQSIRRAIRANLRERRYAQGGSTITQQLIRNTLLTTEKTLIRKVNEVSLALVADAVYSKETILQAYLNRVYLGQWGSYRVNGVAEAARHFFGSDLSELTAAECALLAALIRAPNVITPHKHPERARNRRNTILGLLFKAGKISRDVFEDASAAPVNMRKPPSANLRAPAFLEQVKERLSDEADGRKPDKHVVVTSLDPLLQSASEGVLRRMGDLGLQAHLIIMDPRTGAAQAWIAPVPRKWNGEGGSFEAVLPFAIIPALVPQPQENMRFTFTSPLVASGSAAGTMTVREAFTKDREQIVKRLVANLGAQRVMDVLRQFGIEAAVKGDNTIEVMPVSPRKMAQTYGILAGLGQVVPIGLVPDDSGDDPNSGSSRRDRVPVKPSFLFLVNHLLKEQPADSGSDSDAGPDRSEARPSLFVARDSQGLWGVCYREDALVLLRLPGKQFNDAKIRETLVRLLPPFSVSSETRVRIPEGVVFRKICLDSGLRATSMCGRVITEAFIKGTQPGEWCSLRHDAVRLRSGAK